MKVWTGVGPVRFGFDQQELVWATALEAATESPCGEQFILGRPQLPRAFDRSTWRHLGEEGHLR